MCEEPSGAKNTLAEVVGLAQAYATGPFPDELVKNALMGMAGENFEIAAYKALIVAANELGDPATARVCEENLREEEAMARFIDEHLPMIVAETLRKAGGTGGGSA